jgi:hypothetical protein
VWWQLRFYLSVVWLNSRLQISESLPGILATWTPVTSVVSRSALFRLQCLLFRSLHTPQRVNTTCRRKNCVAFFFFSLGLCGLASRNCELIIEYLVIHVYNLHSHLECVVVYILDLESFAFWPCLYESLLWDSESGMSHLRLLASFILFNFWCFKTNKTLINKWTVVQYHFRDMLAPRFHTKKENSLIRARQAALPWCPWLPF